MAEILASQLAYPLFANKLASMHRFGVATVARRRQTVGDSSELHRSAHALASVATALILSRDKALVRHDPIGDVDDHFFIDVAGAEILAGATLPLA